MPKKPPKAYLTPLQIHQEATRHMLASMPGWFRWFPRIMYAIGDIGWQYRWDRMEKRRDAEIAAMPLEERKKHTGLNANRKWRDLEAKMEREKNFLRNKPRD